MEENWGRAELQIDELGPFDKTKAKSPLGKNVIFMSIIRASPNRRFNY